MTAFEAAPLIKPPALRGVSDFPDILYNNVKEAGGTFRTDNVGSADYSTWSLSYGFGAQETPPILRGEKLPTVWYRILVPPGVTALHLPRLPHTFETYLNGTPVHADANGRLPISGLHSDGRDVLALRLAFSDEVPDYLVFDTGRTDLNLMSLTLTGLQNYSGQLDYEQEFELPTSYVGAQLVLDLGRVGVAAEVWLNGRKIGERAWRPFTFDITASAKPGTNRLRVRVVNSDSNGRWEANWRRVYRDRLDLNGLIGPVRVLPYQGVKIACRRR